MPIEQVHDLVAHFLGQHTFTNARTQAGGLRWHAPQERTLATPHAKRETPTQERGEVLVRSRAAARTMDAGLRALHAAALDETAYQTLLQTVRTGTAIPPALARLIARFDRPAERPRSKPAAAD